MTLYDHLDGLLGDAVNAAPEKGLVIMERWGGHGGQRRRACTRSTGVADES
jgi:hypothetical protein